MEDTSQTAAPAKDNSGFVAECSAAVSQVAALQKALPDRTDTASLSDLGAAYDCLSRVQAKYQGS